MPTRGFTLIESLVVIAIILILTALILPDYNFGEKSLLLAAAAAQINQDLRTIEEMAISAKDFHDFVPQGGYGIYFNSYTSYIIFADCSGNFAYNPSGTFCNGFSELIEQKSLSGDVQFKSAAPVFPLTIVFTPPTPKVAITGGASEASVVLGLKSDSSRTRTIKINNRGLIEFY